MEAALKEIVTNAAKMVKVIKFADLLCTMQMILYFTLIY